MFRYLVLSLLTAFGVYAQISSGDAVSQNCTAPNTFTTFPASSIVYPIAPCQNATLAASPQLHQIIPNGTSQGQPVYDLYVANSGEPQVPSVCFGNAEAYDTSTNSFRTNAPSALRSSPPMWVQVCRPVVVLAVRPAVSGTDTIIKVASPVTLSTNQQAGVPAEFQKPVVMIVNNANSKASMVSVNLNDRYGLGRTDMSINQVTPLGVYGGSGFPRYQLSGLNFGTRPPVVQLLSGQTVALDAYGDVLTRTPYGLAPLFPSDVPTASSTVAWLPVQSPAQLIESSPTMALFQTTWLNCTLLMPVSASGQTSEPNTIIRGYLLNPDTLATAGFSYVP